MGKNAQAIKVLREFSAGGAVYRKYETPNMKYEIRWLVAKNNPSKLYPQEIWRLQKGWIDNESKDIPGPISKGDKKATEDELREAALREVKEEGGVEAGIIKKIGTIKYFVGSTRGKVLKFVTFYLMEWAKDLPEGFGFETSEVAWLPYSEAYEKLTYQGEKDVLKMAKELLEGNSSS